MTRTEKATLGLESAMQERAAAWKLVDDSIDPETGYVPIKTIEELLSVGGMATVVGNDAMRYVDPEILNEELKEK